MEEKTRDLKDLWIQEQWWHVERVNMKSSNLNKKVKDEWRLITVQWFLRYDQLLIGSAVFFFALQIIIKLALEISIFIYLSTPTAYFEKIFFIRLCKEHMI